MACFSAAIPSRRVVLEESAVGVPGVCLFGYHRNVAASMGIAPHVHPHVFELVYVVSGELHFEASGGGDVLHGGDLYLTQPGQRHSTGASPTGVCEFYWLQLNAHSAECLGLNEAATGALLAALRGVQCCALHGSTRWDKAFATLLRLLAPTPHTSGPSALAPFTPVATPPPLPAFALQAACALLPILCDAIQRGAARRGCTPDIEAAQRFVHTHVHDTLPLAALARAAGLSVARLKTKFMQQVGVSPRAYVNLAKIEAAKQKLAAGNGVTDTAFALSFSSSSYFATLFKKFTGQSPTQFAQAAISSTPASRLQHTALDRREQTP